MGYKLKCDKCGQETELDCSYEEAVNTYCGSCGGYMELLPKIKAVVSSSTAGARPMTPEELREKVADIIAENAGYTFSLLSATPRGYFLAIAESVIQTFLQFCDKNECYIRCAVRNPNPPPGTILEWDYVPKPLSSLFKEKE